MRHWLLVSILLSASVLAVTPANPGDLNGDNVVNIADITLIAGCLGQNAATCQGGKADPNNDNQIDLFDFIQVSQFWAVTYTTAPPYVESCGNAVCNATAGESCSTCSADCGVCAPSQTCGNDVREGTEVCDGSDLGSSTCVSLGFAGGPLSCSASCQFVTSACTSNQPTTFAGPNLPAGFTPVVFRQFDSKASADADRGTGSFPSKTTGSEGWDGIEYNKANLQVVSSGYTGAPLYSGPNVMQWTYPVSQTLGSSPGTAQTQDLATSGKCAGCPRALKSIYIHYVFQVSPDFYGATDNGVNKMLFLQGIANNFLVLKGKGTGALQLQMNAQGSGGTGAVPSGNWLYNGSLIGYAVGNTGATTAIQRGQWYEVEWLEEAGTYGQSDGRVRLWINGVLTHDYQNVEIYAASNTASSKFTALQISPTYGSTTSLTLGGTGGQQQYLWVDTLNVWGAP